MEINKLYTLLAGAAMLVATACSPDDHDLASTVFVADDLVEGIAFTVTPDANDPNVIHLESLVKGCTPLWETPQGRSQAASWSIQLPFAGEYEVTFGVMTQAGNVYGNPYHFTVTQNNFGMLSDEIWTNLAGGVDDNGNGNPKTWVPMDRSYGVGHGSAPVMYMNPDDVKNDGTGVTDLLLGSANWSPNWDPGFQSWLIPADDPYMQSRWTFGLDPIKGCTLSETRMTASGEETVVGSFTLNNSDPKRPLISFNGGTYALHNTGFDGVCANYTTEIKIIECTPYVLQLATMRTNSEGPWWLVWNFVAEEVQNGSVVIPTEGPELLQTTPVVEPEYADLAESLFSISGSDATYVATQTTYLLNEEKPYDWLWWNGATAAWEAINGYGSSWAPTYDGIEDFSMVLAKKGDASFTCEIESAEGTQSANFTVSGNKMIFDQSITLLSVGNISITATEFTVLKCSADDNEVLIGIPDGKDDTGTVNKYLCANFTIKPIGGGAEGPTEIKVDNSKLNCYIEANDHYRIELYNPWGSADWPIDITKVKLKKNQTLSITFSIDGITWNDGAEPKVLLANNIDALGFSWPSGGSGFDVPEAVSLNKYGPTTITLTNTTGSTVTFDGSSCVTLCISVKGLVASPLDADGMLDPTLITPTISSMTIQ